MSAVRSLSLSLSVAWVLCLLYVKFFISLSLSDFVSCEVQNLGFKDSRSFSQPTYIGEAKGELLASDGDVEDEVGERERRGMEIQALYWT
ncbi:hypothetical protein EUGRSUZ_D00615 [Eucalyptus grandis]|uniref:Uncharacterized protein n=2 Tax=Eucalyptus grandis TaxID=71139 RepID=A0ACC3L397_EUCGR|nr:hypothetical protein EUGRSUZ_D00615 [Eucalyptus grandis]